MTSVVEIEKSRCKYSPLSERSGVSPRTVRRADDSVHRGAGEFPLDRSALRRRRAQPAWPLLSHDDMSLDQRRWYRALGCARRNPHHDRGPRRMLRLRAMTSYSRAECGAAAESHLGWTNAAEMVARGLCPSWRRLLLSGAAARGVSSCSRWRRALERAWLLVSSDPARSMGLAIAERSLPASGPLDTRRCERSGPSACAAAIVAGRPSISRRQPAFAER